MGSRVKAWTHSYYKPNGDSHFGVLEVAQISLAGLSPYLFTGTSMIHHFKGVIDPDTQFGMMISLHCGHKLL
jgi:hypothetical protein